ncbi:MAG: polysaccharide biosynthesis protein, partial [Chloroflexaceae bacterium]|nr:polysaccharide biosynthesis protein [Chloroflexaceae bacterium]
MKGAFRNRYFLLSDLLLIPLAAYISFVLRLDDLNLSDFWAGFLLVASLALLVLPLLFRWGGIYSRYWPYASVDELLRLTVMVATAVALVGAIGVFLGPPLLDVVVPRSIPFIFFMLALAATGLPRLLVRAVPRYITQPRPSREAAMRVLVMGAGDAGAALVREIRRNPQAGMQVVGLLDDNPAKQHVYIHGVRVMGTHLDIPKLVSQHTVQMVAIAMPTAPGKTIRHIVQICEQVGVRTKIMPGIHDLLDGRVSINQLRNVDIEDLLRRQPVETEIAAVAELIRGRRVLITGGGGSIGSELCRQVARFAPSELIILGHGENSIFNMQNELRAALLPETQLHTVIADIRFAGRMLHVFQTYEPEIVFHAAAHKHVPLMELNPVEAVTNNILGTSNLLQAAQATGVDHFVMISTDKAVNPVSVMGACKRVAELLVHQAAVATGKAYVAVRFGNVLGSRGSVVLTFKQQIAAGGPVTVTHPEMRRYFMTIPEAVQLVLQAATLGHGGEVFTLDMGEPVKIVDMARDMIELSGLEVGRDIDIVYTGLRPGEKLFEELFVPGESYERTIHEKIFIACNASSFVPRDLDELM